MSLPPKRRKFAKDDTDYRSKPLIRKPVSSKLIPGAPNIFDSRDIENRSTSFDIQVPGANQGTNILQIQNPGLLAFRNKADKFRETEFIRAESQCAPKAITSSLLARKPLGKLRDPTDIPALETVQKMIENERNSLAFPGDPVAYFSKRKDGRGHLFIYLLYAMDPKDPFFSPYELKKVTSADIRSDRDYFTMSATGVTLVQADGNTEHVTLDQWARDSSSFITLRKLKFFSQYFYWKPFRLLKKFILQNRFSDLKESMHTYPFFKNVNFFHEFMKSAPKTETEGADTDVFSYLSLLNIQETGDALLKQYLLSSFQSAKKYRIDEFEATNKSNIENLKKEFSDFISNLQESILLIYEKVSNPELVQVNDSDFPEIRRRNPNLGQLMVLEKKKAAARNDKTKMVNREIGSIGSFIRMVDYILLECLTSSCKTSWKTAESNVSDPSQGTIFQVEVLFNDEGNVVFKPLLKDLLHSISWALKASVDTLNSLPRLILMPKLRPLLRDNGLNLKKLYKNGPQFSQIINQENALDKIKKSIKDSVRNAYELALKVSQSYTKFYPIFKLGQTWDPRDYIITRKGEKYNGSLQIPPGEDDDEFLLKHMDEPVVDFDRVEQDIQRFRKDEERVRSNKSLASGQSKLALYIDTKNIRDTLTPIPTKALNDLIQILNDLIEYKNAKISNALKFYDKRLKQVPRQLDNFVEFCEILQRTIDVTPQIKAELDFVDRMIMLFEKFDMSGSSATQITMFHSFEMAKKQAQQLRDQSLEEFVTKLKTVVRETERKIDHFYEKATTVPATMKDADIDSRLPSAQKLCVKVEKMSPDIDKIVKYQEIIGVELNNFSAFLDVSAAAKFAVRLYTAVSQWQGISKQMTSIPFANINIDDFHAELDSLKEVVSDLQATAKTNYPILNELVSKVNEISPFISELEHLSKGKMQVRHWNTLFEECQQQNSYHTQITIEELLSLGILQMKDKIESITATSHGESELEAEFQQISNHWNKVQLPLVDQQIKTDETLLLGPTDNLVSEIYDTLATLQKMLALPFVQGVREAVTSLSMTLENITQILDAWRVFQSNWVVLSALFNLEEARAALPHQANRFATVQRKWISIARNTMKDTRLFSVCAFPSLLDVLNENNKSMESILTALGKFLDTKRSAMPRLFFLSNDEVLTLASTNIFSVFSRTITKLFMHIKSFDYKDIDTTEREVDTGNQSFQRMKIYGIVSEDGDILPFSKYVSCASPLENWLTQLIETMRNAVRDSIASSSSNAANGNFADWVCHLPVYIAYTALNFVFTREMDECFSAFESSPKIFSNYEKTLAKRADDITDFFHNKNPTPDQQRKLSVILTQLIALRDILSLVHDKNAFSSQQFIWQHNLKFRVQPNTQHLVVEFGDITWDHGLEFWGTVPRLIQPPGLEATRRAFITALSQGNVPVLSGSDASGRQQLLRNLACQIGRFVFVARPFPDINELFMSRILIGAASSGSWTIFTNIDLLSHKCLCYLFDNIRSLNVAQAAGNPRITISSRLVDLNKGCRIFVSSHPLKEKMPEFPPQFRSFLRPVSMPKPDYTRFAEIKLISLGFKNAKINAPKIAESVYQIVNFFSSALHSRTTLFHILMICDQSFESVVEFGEEFNEESVIAFTIYQYFRILLTNDVQRNTMLKTLYATFRIYNTFDEFVDHIERIIDIPINKKIVAVAEREIQKLGQELPTEYIVKQVLTLYHMMIRDFCTIIAGPPNSGKSLIVKILSKCLEDPEVQECQCRLKPFSIRTMYHASDLEPHIFGNITNDLSLGQIWSYGQIQAILTSLYSIGKQYTAVFMFNGPLTPSYVKFLTQFLGSPSLNRCMLNSLDSYKINEQIKVIVETDSLDNVTPGLLTRSNILIMNNAQSSLNTHSIKPTCSLEHPSIPFSRALTYANGLDPESIAKFRTQFCEIAPNIVRRIYHTKNQVCSSETDTHVLYGEILLTEILPMYAAIFAFLSVEPIKLDLADEKQIKTLIVISFFRVFSSFLDEKEMSSFDTWLRTTYTIDAPPDWVGYSVPDHFWETFKRPSLWSLRLFKGKLIPLDFAPINEKPIINMRSDNMLPILQDEVMFIHAQMLQALHISQTLLKNKINFIINGCAESGKSTFINLMFRDIEGIIPIIIPSSKYHSQETLLSYISLHTNLISKIQVPMSQMKTFALVFENVEASHTNLLEFIRMLMVERQIPIYSTGDQKIYEQQKVNNFIVIISTREYEKLPVRFLTMFFPISLHKLSQSTASFIAAQTMVTYGNEEEYSKEIVKIISQILQQFPTKMNSSAIIKAIYIFCHIENKTNKIANLKTILGQMYYFVFHQMKIEDYSDKLSFMVKSYAQTDEETETVEKFLEYSSIYYPKFTISKDLKNFDVTSDFKQFKPMKEEMTQSLSIYNTNSNEKIVLRFSRHVLFHISLVHTALNCPGRNLIIRGKPGSGRYTITRFVTNLLESDFVNIGPPSPDEELSGEERLSGFHGLIRDVITNATVHQKKTVIFLRLSKHTKTEAEFLINFVSQRDFTSFFTSSQLDDLYIRFTGLHSLNYEQRLVAWRQIRNLLKLNIHIVISQDLADNTSIESTKFDHILLESDRPENYKSTALDCLDGLASRKLIINSKDKLPGLFFKLCEIARFRMQYFHINYYYDFVDSFAHFSAADYQDVLSMNENIQSALEFLARLETESHQIDKKLDSLAPTLQRLQIDSETLLSSYTTRKEAIETRRAKLDEEHREKAEEVSQLEEAVTELKAELENKQPKIDQNQKIVEELNDNDIETIRITAADPMPSLRLLLEIFCLILDRPASYERAGQKLLMDPKFIETVVAHVSKTTMTPQLLALIEPYFEMEALNPDELESIAPSLKSLFDWIECVCKVAILRDKLLKKKKELEDKQRQLNEYVEEMNLEKSSIEQVEASLENENKALAASTAAREEMEKEYQSVDARKKSIDSIFKGIEHFTEKWQDEASKFAVKKEKLIGDCILFAFYLVFCGAMDSENKKLALEAVVGEIRLAGIDTNFEDPMRSIADKFVSANTEDISTRTDLMFSMNAVVDSHHVRSTFRTPLLLDPDGLVLNFLISSIKPKRLIVVSQNSSTLDTTLANAICDGKTLILQDADYLHPLIVPLMPLDLFTLEQNTVREIRINTKLTTWDPRFKLILVSSFSDAKHLPENLLSRVTLINVSSSSLETTKTFLTNTFIDFFDPELIPKISSMHRSELSQRVQIQKYERDTLDILSDIVATQQTNPEYDYLSDEETLADLIRSKDCYFKLLNTNTDFSALKEEIKTTEQPFRNHVRLCHTFWEVMSRILPQVSEQARFSFNSYQKQISSVFVNEGLHAGTLTSEQHATLHSALINATFQFIFQTIPVVDSFFFLFISSFKLREFEEKLYPRDLRAVMTHIKDEYNSIVNFKYFEPDNTGDPFDHLKYTNIANVYEYVKEFISEQFGPEFTSFIQHFQVDSIISNTATVPTLIVASPIVDPTSLVHLFVNLRCRHENFDAISLSDDLEVIRNTRKMLVTALNRGNWVLIHYSKPNKSAADMLVDVFMQMTTTSVNTNFRLIVICSTLKYLSPSMIAKSKRVNVEKFPSIRNNMLMIYHHHNSSIRSATNPKMMKKLSYAAALLVASMNFRSFIQPIGFNYYIYQNDMVYKDFIDVMRAIIDSSQNDVPLKSIRSILEDIIFPSIFDEYDKRILRSQILNLFMTDTADDGFSPCKDSDEAEIWTIPSGDLPVSNYSQTIQQIPFVSSTQILQMNKEMSTPLMNWNLSRWISKPFLKYQSTPPKIDVNNALVKIDNFTLLLPEKIGSNDEYLFDDLSGLFLYSEIVHLNKVLTFLKDELSHINSQLKENIITEDARLITRGIVPKKWKEFSNYFCTNSINKFATQYIETHAFLMKWMKDGLPHKFDAKLIHNMKSLLNYYLIDISSKSEMSSDLLTIEFSFADPEMEPNENQIMLTNLTMACGSIDEKGFLNLKSDINEEEESAEKVNENDNTSETQPDSKLAEGSQKNETNNENSKENQNQTETQKENNQNLNSSNENQSETNKQNDNNKNNEASKEENKVGNQNENETDENNKVKKEQEIEHKPFTTGICLLCNVVKKAARQGRTFRCPLYKSFLIKGLNRTDEQIDPVEGESNNFVWEIELPTDQAEKQWIEMGTSLVCCVPEQFT
ncbi:Dynein heavy chain family protein [Tritrichomonas foetus]|uniref:Dynein heavy chain family protein n=1 Tax=Tritrichomonas foetus TaxID=1144522 RepID=A0A1J4JJ96_9EUKA|nr:Dynein heavy chain family protein [Tritrichomonas foetus]|eukprot:OHS99238.1 Dynein heavy chain family protein [Tritrichomonas foetus]